MTKLPPHTPAELQLVLNFATRFSWGISDPNRFFALLDEAKQLVNPGFHIGDNFFTWFRSNSFLDDQTFRSAWQSNLLTDADEGIAWRRFILVCAAYHCVHLPGDFVECGVLQGSGIKTVIDYFGRENFSKIYWGYDTFDKHPADGHQLMGMTEGLLAQVQQRFSGYSQVRLVPGLLPASLINNSPEMIAFLHIDLNSAEFEIAVLDALFDRVVPGGIIILDDYEAAGSYRHQKIAEDAWFDQRGYKVFPLPTGQGLVLKR